MKLLLCCVAPAVARCAFDAQLPPARSGGAAGAACRVRAGAVQRVRSGGNSIGQSCPAPAGSTVFRRVWRLPHVSDHCCWLRRRPRRRRRPESESTAPCANSRILERLVPNTHTNTTHFPLTHTNTQDKAIPYHAHTHTAIAMLLPHCVLDVLEMSRLEMLETVKRMHTAHPTSIGHATCDLPNFLLIWLVANR